MIPFFINILGLLCIIAVILWFWIVKPKTYHTSKNKITEIKVKDGAYQPANIEVPVNTPFVLRFIREDATPCAEYVVFPALNISKQLPMNQPVELTLNIKEQGTYEFTCQMAMYRGKLIAK